MKLRSALFVVLLYVSLCLILALLIEKDYFNYSNQTAYLKAEPGLSPDEAEGRDAEFTWLTESSYSLGYFSEDLWIRILLPPEIRTGSILEINKSSFTRADFYFPLRDGTVHKITKAGKLSYRTQSTMVPDNVNPREPVFVRLQTPLAFNFEVRFWEAGAFVRYILRDYLFFGIIYGILISIVIYNTILFLILKKKSYLYFFLFGLGTLFWCMLTYGHIEVFLPFHDINQNRISLPVVGIVWYANASFLRSFLKTKIVTPRLDVVISVTKVMAGLLCLLGIAGFINAGHFLDTVLSYILPPFALIMGVVSLRKGFKPASWFLAGWTVFLLGTIVYALAGGPIPRNSLTLNLFATGAAFSSLLLSYALTEEMRVLKIENTLLSKKSRLLKKVSMTDTLTQLHNRASFNENLDHEIILARKSGHPLSLIMIDVDHFKKFNDSWGHPEGDRVLRAMGPILSQGVRDQDYACRYGGEEFALILPGASEQEALDTAERIRLRVEETDFPIAGSCNIEKLTISLGVAVFNDCDDVLTLTERADKALYRAKNLGRNRVSS